MDLYKYRNHSRVRVLFYIFHKKAVRKLMFSPLYQKYVMSLVITYKVIKTKKE